MISPSDVPPRKAGTSGAVPGFFSSRTREPNILSKTASAVLAGAGLRALLPVLRRIPVVAAIAAGAYAGSIVVTMAALHPLEYIAMNALAGGTRGAYQRFELDYWSAAATEALRRLERRLDHEKAFTETPPSITICIPWREWMVGPMLHKPWKIETDPEQADFIIETERSRCAAKVPTTLIDEVKRFDRTFAWIYAAHPKIGDVPAMSRSH